MVKASSFEIKDVDSLKNVLRDYHTLHAQILEHNKKAKPITKRINEFKKALLTHMLTENLKKVQLPNKDLLVLNETRKKPSLSEKYLRGRLDSFYVNDEPKANELFAFLQAVPDGEMQVRTTLKHLESDSYVENESEVGDDEY